MVMSLWPHFFGPLCIPCKDVRIVGVLEGAFQLFQLIAAERCSVSPLLRSLERLSRLLACWCWVTDVTVAAALDIHSVRENVCTFRCHLINPVFTARCCASAVLAIWACVRVCLCMSVTSRSSIETDERIELGFVMWASFHPSYAVLKGNSVISKIRAHLSGTL